MLADDNAVINDVQQMAVLWSQMSGGWQCCGCRCLADGSAVVADVWQMAVLWSQMSRRWQCCRPLGYKMIEFCLFLLCASREG
jgi:hypothetical protein